MKPLLKIEANKGSQYFDVDKVMFIGNVIENGIGEFEVEIVMDSGYDRRYNFSAFNEAQLFLENFVYSVNHHRATEC